MAATYLVRILNKVEAGIPWPQQLCKARCAYLPKQEGAVAQPLKLRGLLMLSCLYRAWSKMRLHALEPWVKTWAVEELHAGVRGRSAQEGWYAMGVVIEQGLLLSRNFTATAFDLWKAFDQINRGLMMALLIAAGMPTNVVVPYFAMLEHLRVTASYGNGLGAERRRKTAIPHGVPL